MGFLTDISRKQKREILYRYLVLGQRVSQIHNDFRGKVSLGYFHTIPAKLMAQEEYIEYSMEILIGEGSYDMYKNNNKALGRKSESYWRNEDEMIFHKATYNTLSHEERLIFSESYLENFLETRNQAE